MTWCSRWHTWTVHHGQSGRVGSVDEIIGTHQRESSRPNSIRLERVPWVIKQKDGNLNWGCFKHAALRGVSSLHVMCKPSQPKGFVFVLSQGLLTMYPWQIWKYWTPPPLLLSEFPDVSNAYWIVLMLRIYLLLLFQFLKSDRSTMNQSLCSWHRITDTLGRGNLS